MEAAMLFAVPKSTKIAQNVVFSIAEIIPS